MWIVNDLHFGVKRTAGTTHESQKVLTDWQFMKAAELLSHCKGPLTVNGDLFDKFEVDNATFLSTYGLFDTWLTDEQNSLTLIAGNHDLSRDSSKVSALAMLGVMLFQRYGKRVSMVNGFGAMIGEGVYAISHVANQDLFDVQLKTVPPEAAFVLLHCNYDNKFAEQSDHSLNLSPEQAAQLPGFIVLGHEHQYRTALDEKVVIVGNQLPTSIADCLGPDWKYVAYLDSQMGGVRVHPWLHIPEVFARIDWRDLGKVETDAKFIRVEGEAAAAEAASVITAISRYRQKSKAFVITNAVSIEGAAVMAGVMESLRKAASVDVFVAILNILNEKQKVVVRRLLDIHDA